MAGRPCRFDVTGRRASVRGERGPLGKLQTGVALNDRPYHRLQTVSNETVTDPEARDASRPRDHVQAHQRRLLCIWSNVGAVSVLERPRALSGGADGTWGVSPNAWLSSWTRVIPRSVASLSLRVAFARARVALPS